MVFVKKVVLGGAALIGAMLLVVSAAWACSPYASEGALDPLNPVGPELREASAGTPLLIRGIKYEADYGTQITIEWVKVEGSDFGQVLDRQVLEYYDTWHTEKWDPETEKMIPVSHRFHWFSSSIKVPNVATGSIYVVQRRDDGGIGLKTAVLKVTPATSNTSVPPSTAPATTVKPQPEDPQPGLATPLVPSLSEGTTTPRPGAGARAGAPGVRRDAAQPGVVVTVVGGGAAAGRSELPIVPVEGSPGRFEVAPWVDPPALDVQTLWSGLGKSDGLTGGSPAQPGNRAHDESSRLGVGLLTLGAVVLLGGALVIRPFRRRALA